LRATKEIEAGKREQRIISKHLQMMKEKEMQDVHIEIYRIHLVKYLTKIMLTYFTFKDTEQEEETSTMFQGNDRRQEAI